MPIVKIPSVALGVNSDLMPEELPLGQWSDGLNVRFRDGFLERTDGMASAFTAPSVTPYYIASYQTATQKFAIHAGTGKVFCDVGAARTDLTPASDYLGTYLDRWSGGTLNGVMVLNNGVNVPQYWMGDTAADFADLPAWPATYRAASVRPWKNYLFALDITKGGVRYPYMVKWSSAADPGTYPTSWNEADPSNDAGELDLAETPDSMVDCLPLVDALCIYKSRSMYLARYIGGPYVFQFSRLPGETGLLARGCVVQTPLGHVALTHGDVILHSGSGPRSIADAKARRTIFGAIDATNPNLAFLVLNTRRNEVWVCYPRSGETSCSRAAVWNWADDTWTYRSLPSVTYGTAGQFTLTGSSDPWSSASGDWASDSTTWNDTAAPLADARVLLAHATPAISMADSGQLDLGSGVTAYAERTGMHFDEPQRVKVARAVWLRVDAANGTELTVQMGGSMTPDVAPTYGAPMTFTVGTSVKVDGFASGRFLALKIASTGSSAWRVRGLDIDISMQGRF